MLTELVRSVRQWMSAITVSDETKIALVAIGVLLVFGYFFVLPRLRRRRHSHPAIAVKARKVQQDTSKADDWVVVCQNCGARNPVGYRYCHNCINRLPSTVRRSWDDDRMSDQ
ncbi:DUF7577 domain-containing protein [Haloplanus halobius]|uniref:DUF7577 domain-containing protein n=2 Tax=Halobacteria TaxID=183963 RepID=UPI003CE565C2